MKPIVFCAERLPAGGAVQRPIPVNFDKFPHLIVQGGTGTGKSIASLLAASKISQPSGAEVYILDFKSDLDTFKFCHGKDCRYWRFQDCEVGLNEYYDLLQAELASDDNSGPHKVRWLWIDELGSYLLNSEKKAAESMRAKITTILMMGRSRRFFCLTSVQRASVELFAQGARDNYSCCLRKLYFFVRFAWAVTGPFLLPDDKRYSVLILPPAWRMWRLFLPPSIWCNPF